MNARDFAHTALRVAAVIILIDILLSLPMAFTAARYYAPSVINLEILETTLPPYLVSLCGAILMYLFAGRIADWVMVGGKPEPQTSPALDIGAVEQLAIVIFGLYLVVIGLSDVVHSLIRYVAIKHAMSQLSTGASSIASVPDTAKFGDAVFRAIVGGWLIGNADVFIRLKNWLRAKRGAAPDESHPPQG
jgi:hypothetical protein